MNRATVEDVLEGIEKRLTIPTEAYVAKFERALKGKVCPAMKYEGKRSWQCQLIPPHKGKRHKSLSGHREWD